MAIQFTDFSDPNKWAQNRQEGIANFLPNYLKGYETARAPEVMDTDLALKKAQTVKALKEAQTPSGSLHGAAANIKYLEDMKKNPNSDPAVIKKIEEQIAFDRKREEGIYESQKKYSDSLYYRNAPANIKLTMNLDKLGQNKGYDMEGNEVTFTPKESSKRRDLIVQEIYKNIQDPELVKRIRYGSNFDKTLSNINPEEAFAYSGGWGNMAKSLQKGISSLTGKQSESFKKFEENLTALEIASHQLSQFLDIGAAQKLQEDIKFLVNPDSWEHSPEVAMAKYKKLVSVFHQEYDNLLKFAVDPASYGYNIEPAGADKKQEAELENQMKGAIKKSQSKQRAGENTIPNGGAMSISERIKAKRQNK